jgi:hypothetical protein
VNEPLSRNTKSVDESSAIASQIGEESMPFVACNAAVLRGYRRIADACVALRTTADAKFVLTQLEGFALQRAGDRNDSRVLH